MTAFGIPHKSVT